MSSTLLLYMIVLICAFVLITAYFSFINTNVNQTSSPSITLRVDNFRSSSNENADIKKSHTFTEYLSEYNDSEVTREMLDECGIEGLSTTAVPHMVPPPPSNLVLVSCNTTKGRITVGVRKGWAPIGAQRFLEMVNTDFFSSRVGLFRALKGFLIQFGLSGNTTLQSEWHRKGNLKDDTPWLPYGPSNRERDGVLRYKRGYMAYAGAGNNSRGTQLILAFSDNKYLGGGCPWEIPFAQLVGKSSYETLDKVYTGYGEKVSQGKIMNRGNAYLEQEFPLLDYIESCYVVKKPVNRTRYLRF